MYKLYDSIVLVNIVYKGMTMKMSMASLFLVCLLLWGCSSHDDSHSFPPVTKQASDCAADGVGCKQFNPNL